MLMVFLQKVIFISVSTSQQRCSNSVFYSFMVPPLSPFIDGFINHCYPHPGSQVSDEYFGISSVVTLYNEAKAQKNQKNKQSEI